MYDLAHALPQCTHSTLFNLDDRGLFGCMSKFCFILDVCEAISVCRVLLMDVNCVRIVLIGYPTACMSKNPFWVSQAIVGPSSCIKAWFTSFVDLEMVTSEW